MSPVAPFGSILFDRPSGRSERDDPSMFCDLNLEPGGATHPGAGGPAVSAGSGEIPARGSFDLALVPPGEPLPTSYGEDLYRQMFGTAD